MSAGKEPERLLCGRCSGEGRIWPYTLPDGRVVDTCTRCKGSGAVYPDGTAAPAASP